MDQNDPTGELPVAAWLDYLLAANRKDGPEVAARTLELLLAHVYRMAYRDLTARLPPHYRTLLAGEEPPADPDRPHKH